MKAIGIVTTYKKLQHLEKAARYTLGLTYIIKTFRRLEKKG